MKISKYILSLSLFAGATMTFSSCSDFLTEDSQTAITEEKMYSDLEYTETNLKSIYSNWRGFFTDRYLWEVLVGTDEIQSGAFQALKSGMERGSLDAYDANLNSENQYTREQWNNRWPIVSSAAKIIKALVKHALSEALSPWNSPCIGVKYPLSISMS